MEVFLLGRFFSSNTETAKSTDAMTYPQGKIKSPLDTSPQSYPRIAP